MSPSDTAWLVASTNDQSVEIEILDAEFRPVPNGHHLGTVNMALPLGLYAVQFKSGGVTRRILTSVDTPGDEFKVQLPDNALEIFSPVPILNSTSGSQIHGAAAAALSRSVDANTLLEDTADLMIFARAVGYDSSITELVRGLQIVDQNDSLVRDLVNSAEGEPDAGWLGCRLSLTPGCYRLRHVPPESSTLPSIETSVYAVRGHQTRLFLMTGSRDDEEPLSASHSVQIAPLDQPFSSVAPDARLTESALLALHAGGASPGQELKDNRGDPMLILFRSLLALRRDTLNPVPMARSFAHLYDTLGPIPDVLAIGWALIQRFPERFEGRKSIVKALEATAHIATPPMMVESWRHLIRATAISEKLISAGSLAYHVSDAAILAGPWLCWAVRDRITEATNAASIPSSTVKDSAVRVVATGARSLWSNFKHWFQKALLESSLSKLQEALANPIAAELIRFSNVSEEERRIAEFLDPSLITGVRELSKRSKRIRKRVRATDLGLMEPAEIVESIGLPVTKIAIKSTSLTRRLTTHLLVPLLAQRSRFVEVETIPSKQLRSIVNEQRSRKTNIKRDKYALDGLSLLHLIYRNLQPTLFDISPTLDETAETLSKVGYKVDGEPISSAMLKATLDSIRSEIEGRIQETVDEGKLQLVAMGADTVLPDPTIAEVGKLLPNSTDLEAEASVEGDTEQRSGNTSSDRE